jgi:hypothetical protein
MSGLQAYQAAMRATKPDSAVLAAIGSVMAELNALHCKVDTVAATLELFLPYTDEQPKAADTTPPQTPPNPDQH